MVRENGTAIPCIQHIYGNPDCEEETVYASEWLYCNTAYEEVKNLVMQFLSAYACSLDSEKSLKVRLLDQIRDQPYLTLTEGFVQEIGDQLTKTAEDLEELNRRVCEALNREFLRTRYGGKYDTEPGNRDLFFRVSSEQFAWADAVGIFLEHHREYPVDTVTVLYDEESTGKDEFLCDKNGTAIDHVSPDAVILQ